MCVCVCVKPFVWEHSAVTLSSKAVILALLTKFILFIYSFTNSFQWRLCSSLNKTMGSLFAAIFQLPPPLELPVKEILESDFRM